MIRPFLFALALLPFSLLLAQSDSSRLEAVMQEFGEWRGASQGDSWGTRSEANIQWEATELKTLRQRVPEEEKLSAAQRINRDLLVHVLDDAIYQRTFGSHRFPLDSEGGFLAGVVYTILGQRVTDEGSFSVYRKRLQDLPAYFEQHITHLRRGLKEGKTDPALVVKNCLDQINRLLATPVAESFFLQPVNNDAALQPTQQRARTQVLEEVVKQSVYPAYQSLRDFLTNEYLPGLRKGIGISGITDGKAYYRQRVKYFTTDDISPEEVFATGQREVARIRAEMEAIVKRTGFSGSFADFLHFLRTDEQFYAKTPEELLSRAAWITKRMEGKLPQYFNQLPRMPLTVSPVPDALAPNYTGGRYSPGSYKRRKAGAFWVNTYDLPSRPFYVLPALALHEGVPGHHTQMMLAAEMEGLPAFRNNLYLSAFGEGWALYCEYLGKEAGIYQTDYEEFGRLVYEMWRACRLVVDPGMHYMGWTRQQAVDFMASNTALSLHEVNTEIDRYIGWPGQAVSYKMGELKIRELRKYAEAELGDRFDIAAFHDLVLANGAITMRGLEGVVKEWVERINGQ
ncbi:DUF885 domain-containing protein [Neolewinella agarilytica]|uniref:DUF885 domain-containing protein n=1 Tax=Neolewinella agarilytica TaxID=478744 RepID=UPI00235403C0|nr:DUF885 domain-containing protein [Neolewinella agarilytica]